MTTPSSMSDEREKALEAARRLSAPNYSGDVLAFYADVGLVARAFLAEPSVSGWREAVLEEAAVFCDEQASIWKEGGGVQIVWAARSLARGIRALKSPSPPSAERG